MLGVWGDLQARDTPWWRGQDGSGSLVDAVRGGQGQGGVRVENGVIMVEIWRYRDIEYYWIIWGGEMDGLVRNAGLSIGHLESSI